VRRDCGWAFNDSVTALLETDQERVTVYTALRLKLHSQTTLTNDGGGDGGRVGPLPAARLDGDRQLRYRTFLDIIYTLLHLLKLLSSRLSRLSTEYNKASVLPAGRQRTLWNRPGPCRPVSVYIVYWDSYAVL